MKITMVKNKDEKIKFIIVILRCVWENKRVILVNDIQQACSRKAK